MTLPGAWRGIINVASAEEFKPLVAPEQPPVPATAPVETLRGDRFGVRVDTKDFRATSAPQRRVSSGRGLAATPGAPEDVRSGSLIEDKRIADPRARPEAPPAPRAPRARRTTFSHRWNRNPRP